MNYEYVIHRANNENISLKRAIGAEKDAVIKNKTFRTNETSTVKSDEGQG